jgi:hypothetical protein
MELYIEIPTLLKEFRTIWCWGNINLTHKWKYYDLINCLILFWQVNRLGILLLKLDFDEDNQSCKT